MTKLSICFTGGYVDAYWPLLAGEDPREVVRMRWFQKMYLARYGRQDIFAWEHRDVNDLNRAFYALSELMREHEAPLVSALENRG